MRFFKSLGTIVLMVLSIQTYAQKQELFSEKLSNTDNKIIFAKIDSKENYPSSLTNDLLLIKQITSHSNSYEYKFERMYSDNSGFTHNVYKSYFKKIEILGLDYVIHSKKGNTEMINGDFKNIDNISISPKLSEDAAKLKATAFFKNSASDILSKTNSSGLVICKDLMNKTDSYRLAYKILVTNLEFIHDKYIYVDAITGEIVQFEPLVCTTNSPGIAQTRYSGTQAFVTDQVGGQFRLREVRNGVNIITRNSNGSGDLAATTATDFWDNDNNWSAIEHGTDQPATDAHWGAEKVFDYWLTQHSRNSINNAGMEIRSYVHFGIATDNAFWSPVHQSMYYGDGNVNFRPLTSLDVCAHELGHGICQFTSNLSASFGSESSALNEGFSDIWGASVEAWAAPTKQRWLIGEEITLAFPGYLRSMSNPSTGAFSPSADTYNSTTWNSDQRAHFRSGVLNKWYFILSEGESGTNDLGNSYNVTGIGITSAARIAYLTEQLLNSSANFSMARTISIQAAIQLFGNCSNEVIQVTNAWHAVGVGSVWVSTNYQFYNPSYGLDCNTVTVTANFPINSNVTWTTTNGLLINGNSSPFTVQSNEVTITSPNGIGGDISASLGGACSISPISFCPCEPWDNPSITWIYGAPRTGEPLQAQVSPDHPSAYKYEWYINGQLVEVTSTTFLSTYNWPCTAEGEGLSVIAVSTCGSSAPVNGGTYSPICYQYRFTNNVKIFPNPASSQVVIQLEQNQDKIAGKELIKANTVLVSLSEVKIIDKIGRTRKVFKLPKGSTITTLDVSDLPTDIYYLEIYDGNTKIRKALSIQN